MKCIRIAGVVIVVGRNRIPAGAGSFFVFKGIIDQVVQVVGFAAEGVDAEEGHVALGLVAGLIGCDAVGRTGGLAVASLVIAICLIALSIDVMERRAVGNEEDESGIIVRILQHGERMVHGGFPVGIPGIGQAALNGMVRAGSELAGDIGFRAGPILNRPGVGQTGELHEGHLDVGGIRSALICEEGFREIRHGLFGRVRAGLSGMITDAGILGISIAAVAAITGAHVNSAHVTISNSVMVRIVQLAVIIAAAVAAGAVITISAGLVSGSVARHTGRNVHDDEHIDFGCRLLRGLGFALEGELDLRRAVEVVGHGLVVIRFGQRRCREGQAQDQGQQQATEELEFLVLHACSPFEMD